MPIWTVERKLLGDLASLRATLALASPVLADCSNLILREDTIAISDAEKIPLAISSNNIVTISIYMIDMVGFPNLLDVSYTMLITHKIIG
ncbi:hypothetical protein CFPU101_24880 [Chroococcus sp. FPU101]|nr:hypothetical protein CFPU101_24880 [Chroococcus sp. FPU101]